MFKKQEKIQERKWAFDYRVDYIDGSVEYRTAFVRAIHIENAFDRASDCISDRVQSDDLIGGATLTCVCLEEE